MQSSPMTYFCFTSISVRFQQSRSVWGECGKTDICLCSVPPTPWWPWWQHTSGCFESPQWLIWFFHSSPRLLALPTQSYLTLGFCPQLASSCLLCTTLCFPFLLGYMHPGLNTLFSPYVIPVQLSIKPHSTLCPRYTSSLNSAQGFTVTSHSVSNYAYIAS